MAIKRYITFIVLLVLVILLAAAFLLWLRWYEETLMQAYRQEQQEIAQALDQRLDEIRQQKLQEQQELSEAEAFIRAYLKQKESYNLAKKEIEAIQQDVLSISDLVSLAEKRIEVSQSYKDFLMGQSGLNSSLDAFVQQEILFVDADIQAYELIREYYQQYGESFVLKEQKRNRIESLLAQSIVLKDQASAMLRKAVEEYELGHLLQ